MPDSTPTAARVRLLETLADEDAASPPLRALAARLPARPRERAGLALLLAQRAPFTADPSGEWFQSAPWTVAHGGDCDDHAEFFVALARAAGLRARVVHLPQPTAQEDHWTAQVSFDPAEVPDALARWEWAEPSVVGAVLGEDPYLAADRLGQSVRLGGTR